jgi:hypothetical protein
MTQVAAIGYLPLFGRCRNVGRTPIVIARSGLSNNAAEEALDQLLNEPKTAPELRVPAAAFVTYARRLAQSVTTFIISHHKGIPLPNWPYCRSFI